MLGIYLISVSTSKMGFTMVALMYQRYDANLVQLYKPPSCSSPSLENSFQLFVFILYAGHATVPGVGQ